MLDGDGRKEGIGILTLFDGHLIIGEFKADRVHGRTLTIFPYGDVYVGQM
jgi:hypothetical protein